MSALAEMIKVARADGNMIEPMLAAAQSRGHAWRDLQRTACRVGRVRRAGSLLSNFRFGPIPTCQRCNW